MRQSSVEGRTPTEERATVDPKAKRKHKKHDFTKSREVQVTIRKW